MAKTHLHKRLEQTPIVRKSQQISGAKSELLNIEFQTLILINILFSFLLNLQGRLFSQKSQDKESTMRIEAAN